MTNNHEELAKYGAGVLFAEAAKKLLDKKPVRFALYVVAKKPVRFALYVVVAVISSVWYEKVFGYCGGAGKIWWLFDLLTLPSFTLSVAAFTGFISVVCGYGIREYPWTVIRLGVVSWIIRASIDVSGSLEMYDPWMDFVNGIGRELLETFPRILAAVGIILLIGNALTRGKRKHNKTVASS